MLVQVKVIATWRRRVLQKTRERVRWQVLQKGRCRRLVLMTGRCPTIGPTEGMVFGDSSYWRDDVRRRVPPTKVQRSAMDLIEGIAPGDGSLWRVCVRWRLLLKGQRQLLYRAAPSVPRCAVRAGPPMDPVPSSSVRAPLLPGLPREGDGRRVRGGRYHHLPSVQYTVRDNESCGRHRLPAECRLCLSGCRCHGRSALRPACGVLEGAIASKYPPQVGAPVRGIVPNLRHRPRRRWCLFGSWRSGMPDLRKTGDSLGCTGNTGWCIDLSGSELSVVSCPMSQGVPKVLWHPHSCG